MAIHSGGIMGRLRANLLNYLLVAFFLLSQLWALIKILRQEQFDTIHAHLIYSPGPLEKDIKALTASLNLENMISALPIDCCNNKQEKLRQRRGMVARHWDCPS